MDDVLEIKHGDGANVVSMKRELSILIKSYKEKDSVADEDIIRVYKIAPSMIAMASVMDEQNYKAKDKELIIYLSHSFLNYGVLSPITFKDAFETNGSITYNIRFPEVILDPETNKYRNLKAYTITSYRIYNHVTKQEVKNDVYKWDKLPTHRIYLTIGGVITGEYISDCYIPKIKVDNDRFTINNAVNLNVDVIIDEGRQPIFIVDKRNTKLHALMKFYDVPVKFDESCYQKYDTRKYKKFIK